jgi:hypothetical protein
VAAFAGVRTGVAADVVKAEVVEPCIGILQQVRMKARMERPTATMARFLAQPPRDPSARSPKKASALPAPAAASPSTRAR